MLTLHSFLRSVVLFVKSLTVKVTKQMYRSSSVVMAGMMVVAIIAFSANGFGGGGRNALAAPMTEAVSYTHLDVYKRQPVFCPWYLYSADCS